MDGRSSLPPAAPTSVGRAIRRLAGQARRVRADLLVFVLSAALFALASRPAARWMADDAGISFVYGVNLGRHGALAPNLEGWAVEGFSNPLTVLVVAVLSALGWFHPLSTHRAIDALVFGGIGVCAFRLLRDLAGASRWAACAALVVFLALEVSTPATMAWYGSGLENGQLSLAVLVLLRRLEVVRVRGARPWADGALLFAVALVRPEAPLFSFTWLATAFFLGAGAAPADSPLPARARARSLLATTAVATALVSGALLLRYRLFGSLFPNTYYAKVHGFQVARHLRNYVLPLLAPYRFAFGFTAGAAGLFAHARGRRFAPALLAFSAAALALPLVAGADWMGHHRFATAFLMLGHLSFASLCCVAWSEARGPSRSLLFTRVVPSVLAAVLLLVFVVGGRADYGAFVRQKYVGFALIADVEGFARVDIQRYLGLVYPVVALPDAGGSEAVDDMQPVDTAWLTDYHMARIHDDMAVVNRYQHDERRVDLAEYHAWTFDRSLIGTRLLPIARLDADDDFEGFFPVYAVRRDLVEDARAGAAAAALLLGADDGLEVRLSERTILAGVPGGLLRVELLVTPQRPSWDASCELRVALAGAAESRRVFWLTPYAEAPIAPTVGAAYRHGFLLPLPAQAGSYPVRVQICAGPGAMTADLPRPVLVRPPAELTEADLRVAVGGASASDKDAPYQVAALREQLVRRMEPRIRRHVLGIFRASRRDRNRTDLRAYDALVDDSVAAFLEPMPAAERTLEDEVLHASADACARLWDARASGVGERTLAVGRAIDELRRLGYLGVVRRPDMRALVDRITGAADPPAADAGDAYARALGLALLVPGNARYQRRLAAQRSRGAPLPEERGAAAPSP